VAVLVAALAFAPSTAGASVAFISGSDLMVLEVPEQANGLLLQDRPDGFITVTDDAGVAAGPGCVDEPTGAVLCPIADVARAVIDTGTGDDDVRMDFGIPALVHGGDGADHIKYNGPYAFVLGSESGVSELHGDAGDDRIEGWLTDEHLFGDAGDDELRSYGGSDVLSGGDGNDTVSYADWATKIRADLDGQPGDGPSISQGDTIEADVENLIGGQAGDELTGNSGPNRLSGLQGNDIIRASGGAADTQPDTVVCGEGFADPPRDREDADTATGDAIDVLDPDCEQQVREEAETPSPTPQRPPQVACGTRRRHGYFRCGVRLPVAPARNARAILSGERIVATGTARAGQRRLRLRARHRVRPGRYTLQVGRRLYAVRVR
jgi:Ca2+-binding RTX toxin-like protein